MALRERGSTGPPSGTRTIDHIKKPSSWKWTTREAWDRFCCARCGIPVHPASNPSSNLGTWSDEDRDEYWISGICPKCWDEVMTDE